MRHLPGTRVLLALGILLCSMVGTSSAQSTLGSFYSTPNAWRPEKLIEPGVDAKGDLGVQIPVLTIPGRNGFDYPVVFSYQSGITNAARSSWIGLGWHFDPGSIVRDPQGLMERITSGNGTYTSHNVDFTSIPKYQPDQYFVTVPGGGGTMIRRDPELIAMRPPRRNTSYFYFTDGQPWKVEFSAANPVVVQDSNGQSMTSSVDGVNKEEFSEFVLTNSQGIRYVFGSPSMNTFFGMRGQPPSEDLSIEHYASTWYLRAVLAEDYVGPNIPTGGEFEGEIGRWIRLDYSDVTMITQASGEGDPVMPRRKIQARTLTKIVTPTHQALFTTGARSIENFLPSETPLYRKLTSIQLQRRDGTVVKTVQLAQTDRFLFYHSADGGELHVPSYQGSRMSLDAISFLGKSGDSSLPGYKFEYYNNPADSTIVDDFGFVESGRNSWNIKKITYPTGGSLEVEYVPDEVAVGELIPFRYEVPTTPKDSLGHYSCRRFEDRLVGGVRVSRLTIDDGMGRISGSVNPSQRSDTFQYGDGHCSSISSSAKQVREMFRNSSNLLLSVDRQRAAVYYEYVHRVRANQSRTVTYYTNPVSDSASVKRAPVIVYVVGRFKSFVQGNAALNWGRPKRIDHLDSLGVLVRRQDQNLSLGTGQLTPPVWRDVSIRWWFEGRLSSSTVLDYGEGGTNFVTQETRYEDYHDGTDGTGLPRRVLERRSDGSYRVTETKWAYDVYPVLYTRNLLTQVAQQSLGSRPTLTGSTTYHRSTVSTWRDASLGIYSDDVLGGQTVLKPWQTLRWYSISPGTVPSFTGTAWSGSGINTAVWHLQRSINAYRIGGQVAQEQDARGTTATLTYNTEGRLSQVSKGGLNNQFTYDLDFGLLNTVTDENGQTQTYLYDAHGRLAETKDRTGTTTATYQYIYPHAPSGTFSATSPSYIRTVLPGGTSPTRETTEYLDGLGRVLQQQNSRPGGFEVRHTEFDAQGRPWRAWKPYSYAASSAAFKTPTDVATGARAYYGASSNPYTESQYRTDPLDRPSKVVMPHNTAAPAGTQDALAEVLTNYRIGTLDGNTYAYTDVTDELGRHSYTYVNTHGQTVRAVQAVGTSEEATTGYVRNVMDEVTELRPPNYYAPPSGSTAAQWVTTSQYNTLGLLRQQTTPDAGTSRYAYDRTDNVRFSQDAVRTGLGQVFFSRYDTLSRRVLYGIATGDFATLESQLASTPTLRPAAEANTATWITQSAYDAKPATTGAAWSTFASRIGSASLSNLLGRSSATVHKSDGVWQLELYSYDVEGRLAGKQIDTQGQSSVYSALSYGYDAQDNLTQRTAAVGSNSFTHWYEYDIAGRLHKTFAATGFPKPSTADLTYLYRPTGLQHSRQFAGENAVGIGYSLRDWITSIGGFGTYELPPYTTLPFAERIAYDRRGRVTQAEHLQAASPLSTKQYRYVFGYDNLDRLLSSDYSPATSVGSSSYTASLAFDESTTYRDRQGNIGSMTRRGQSGQMLDQATYQYAGSGWGGASCVGNRLCGANEDPTMNGLFGIRTTGQYHNANGAAVYREQPDPNNGSYTWSWVLNERDLPTSTQRVLNDGEEYSSAAYRYSASGERYWVQTGEDTPTGPWEYTLLDGASVLGRFTSSGTWQWNVVTPSGAAVGRQPYNGSRRYYHTDHLGSVRAARVSGGSVVEARDYTPWGLAMEGRIWQSDSYAGREGFTGKQRDVETGLDHFGARQYDAALGRWMSVDPLWAKHPEWSPYNYVLANPLGLVDPDGRQVQPNMVGAIREIEKRGEKVSLERYYRTLGEATLRLGGGALAVASIATPFLGDEYFALAAASGLGADAFRGNLGPGSLLNFVPGRAQSSLIREVQRVAGGFKVGLVPMREITVSFGASSERVAVIGRWMEGRVVPFAESLRGVNATRFTPSEQAMRQWNRLMRRYNNDVPDDVARQSSLYMENTIWINRMKAEGYTIIDIGSGGAPSSSVFYEMEKRAIY